MCWTDLVAADNKGQYNRTIAKLFGLNCAVYLEELLNVLVKVKKKSTYDPKTGYFQLNRNYIEDRTTLTVEDQLICDEILTKILVLQSDESDVNQIRIDMNALISIFTSEKTKELKQLIKAAKVTRLDKSAAKKAGQIVTMQKIASEEDVDLNNAYSAWVTSIYASKRFLTKEKINNFKTGIKSKANQNKDVELELIRIATVNSWTDYTWVINSFDRNSRNIVNHLTPTGSGKTESGKLIELNLSKEF